MAAAAVCEAAAMEAKLVGQVEGSMEKLGERLQAEVAGLQASVGAAESKLTGWIAAMETAVSELSVPAAAEVASDRLGDREQAAVG